MAKSLVKIICWEQSHVTDLVLNATQERKLESDIPKMKKVCPNCKPDNRPIVIVSGSTVFSSPKAYRCSHGHLSLISPMDTMLHVVFGPQNDDFVNIVGSLDELANLITNNDITCHHTTDGKMCDSSLVALDDFQLSYPSAPSVKTRVRVGDLWDRHGIEPVRPGAYDRNFEYNETRSEKANKHRLDGLKKERRIPLDRLPGKVMKKPTKRSTTRRDKSSLDFGS